MNKQEIKAEAKSMCESNYYLLFDELQKLMDNSDIIDLANTITIKNITNTIEALAKIGVKHNWSESKRLIKDIEKYESIKQAIQDS